MQRIDQKVQHLYAAKDLSEVLQRSKAKQISLANGDKNSHCNVARYVYWYNKTVSLEAEIIRDGKSTRLLITSNN